MESVRRVWGVVRARFPKATRPWALGAMGLGFLVLVDTIYLATLWPDWGRIARGPIPKTAFIERYEARAQRNDQLPPLAWTPIPFSKIPDHVTRAIIVAEDADFYRHDGVDWSAVADAAKENLDRGRVRYGGSTLSQQTTKNLFLNPDRDLLRKWHELILTWAMEWKVPKWRILTLYLNIAEFGPGVFGVQAASQHYWETSVQNLSRKRAIELAATLPSPRRHNPTTRTEEFNRRVDKIRVWMTAEPEQDPAADTDSPPSTEPIEPTNEAEDSPPTDPEPGPETEPEADSLPGTDPGSGTEPDPEPEAESRSP